MEFFANWLHRTLKLFSIAEEEDKKEQMIEILTKVIDAEKSKPNPNKKLIKELQKKLDQLVSGEDIKMEDTFVWLHQAAEEFFNEVPLDKFEQDPVETVQEWFMQRYNFIPPMDMVEEFVERLKEHVEQMKQETEQVEQSEENVEEMTEEMMETEEETETEETEPEAEEEESETEAETKTETEEKEEEDEVASLNEELEKLLAKTDDEELVDIDEIVKDTLQALSDDDMNENYEKIKKELEEGLINRREDGITPQERLEQIAVTSRNNEEQEENLDPSYEVYRLIDKALAEEYSDPISMRIASQLRTAELALKDFHLRLAYMLKTAAKIQDKNVKETIDKMVNEKRYLDAVNFTISYMQLQYEKQIRDLKQKLLKINEKVAHIRTVHNMTEYNDYDAINDKKKYEILARLPWSILSPMNRQPRIEE